MSPQERIKAIKNKDIKRIQETPTDLFSFEVKSSVDKELKYFVYKSNSLGWTCTCRDFQYRSDAAANGYECKHILRVKNMLKESFKRQMRKTAKEVNAQ